MCPLITHIFKSFFQRLSVAITACRVGACTKQMSWLVYTGDKTTLWPQPTLLSPIWKPPFPTCLFRFEDCWLFCNERSTVQEHNKFQQARCKRAPEHFKSHKKNAVIFWWPLMEKAEPKWDFHFGSVFKKADNEWFLKTLKITALKNTWMDKSSLICYWILKDRSKFQKSGTDFPTLSIS